MSEPEFDKYAAAYEEIHRRNIRASGENPAYFHEYKIADVARVVRRGGRPAGRILDFGSGIGNSLPYWRRYFPAAHLVCADRSPRSIEFAEARYPGVAEHVLLRGAILPFPDQSFDLVFAACVFHHISVAEHSTWLSEMRRVSRPGGSLFVFEHNPLNPLTVAAVRNCAFDPAAVLIRSRVLRQRVAAAGWQRAAVRYRIFFPHFLAFMRPLEACLVWLPLGAQYYVLAEAPA